MKRLTFFLLISASACAPLALEDFKLPYTCDRDAFITPDAGQQCTEGWRCGFDQKCFARVLDDGGLPQAQAWRCTRADQCPDQFKCGVALDDVAFCTQLDAGAPSQCTQTSECEGVGAVRSIDAASIPTRPMEVFVAA